MEERILTDAMLESYQSFLRETEKSKRTIEKYMRDIRKFQEYSRQRCIDKSLVIDYKESLYDRYGVKSINSMLSALHSLFKWTGWHDCYVNFLKEQRQIFCQESKELTRAEYFRLVKTAEEHGNVRLSLIMQTICATGIRISELKFITVAAAKHGKVQVTSKGKTRYVFVPGQLRVKLQRYARQQDLQEGELFITRSGASIDRSNIWREMKILCRQAEVKESKVFPHNLRHLFARTYYALERNIAHLADVLGHGNVETTRIYTISSGAEHARQIERMGLVT